MAHKPSLSFSFQFKSDGSSADVSVALATDPIGFSPPGSTSTISSVSLATATDVEALTGDWDGYEITKNSLVAGIMSLHMDPVPDAGIWTISGRLLF